MPLDTALGFAHLLQLDAQEEAERQVQESFSNASSHIFADLFRQSFGDGTQ